MSETKLNLDSLYKINYAENVEKSLVDFNNWLFGISIGIFGLLVFRVQDFDLTKYSYSELIFKILVIYAMLTIFVTGLTKYHLFIRNNKLSTRYGYLQKLMTLNEINQKEDFDDKLKEGFKKWSDEFNKISLMSQFLNLSIVTTAILIIFFTAFILTLIL